MQLRRVAIMGMQLRRVAIMGMQLRRVAIMGFIASSGNSALFW